MRRMLAILLLLPALGWADCIDSVPNGLTLAPTCLSEINYQECNWESKNYNPTVNCLLAHGVYFVDSGSSLPGSCRAGLDLYRRLGSTGDPSLWWCQSNNTWLQVLTSTATAAGGASVTVDTVNGTDDNFEFFTAPRAMVLVSIGCHCDLNCSTAPTLTFADRAGNAIGLTGGGSLTCSSSTSNTSFTTFDTADGDRILAAGEGLNFSVTNSPTDARINIVFTYN